ncbi:MAG: plasmid pRiA4b ORF-3 family protein [Phormidesmis sp.]
MPSAPAAYQLKISLVDSEPEIWRQVIVPQSITLAQLHLVIQLAMGWENIHPYAFDVGLGELRSRCTNTQPLADTLSAEALAKEEPLYYTYDFESGWLHRITIEAIKAEALDNSTPDKDSATDQALLTCTDGAGACPPEGTGGVWGYDDFLDRLEDSNDPDYLTLIEKYGTFDPDVFDAKAAAARLEAHSIPTSHRGALRR